MPETIMLMIYMVAMLGEIFMELMSMVRLLMMSVMVIIVIMDLVKSRRLVVVLRSVINCMMKITVIIVMCLLMIIIDKVWHVVMLQWMTKVMILVRLRGVVMLIKGLLFFIRIVL